MSFAAATRLRLATVQRVGLSRCCPRCSSSPQRPCCSSSSIADHPWKLARRRVRHPARDSRVHLAFQRRRRAARDDSHESSPEVRARGRAGDHSEIASRRKAPKLGQNFLIDVRARSRPSWRRSATSPIASSSRSARVTVRIDGTLLATALPAAASRLRWIASLAAELRFRFRNQPSVAIVEADVLATDLCESAARRARQPTSSATCRTTSRQISCCTSSPRASAAVSCARC